VIPSTFSWRYPEDKNKVLDIIGIVFKDIKPPVRNLNTRHIFTNIETVVNEYRYGVV
jgi:hypothetical protein